MPAWQPNINNSSQRLFFHVILSCINLTTKTVILSCVNLTKITVTIPKAVAVAYDILPLRMFPTTNYTFRGSWLKHFYIIANVFL